MPIDDGNGRATLASLGAQVAAIDRDYQQLQRAVVGLDTKLETSVTSLSSKLDAGLNALHNKLDAKTETSWGSIWSAAAVGVLIILGVGGGFYSLVRSDNTRLDTAVSAILDRGVFSKQYDADQSRLRDTMRWQDEQINFVRQNFMRSDLYEKLHNELKQQTLGTFAERQVRIENNARHIEEINARQREGLGRIGRLEEAARVAEKNVDVLFARNYKLATEPPPTAGKVSKVEP